MIVTVPADAVESTIYAPDAETAFEAGPGTWIERTGALPRMVDRGTPGKVKSDEPELWLRMTRAPKLVDRIRRDWGWKGVLVKFKLEVGCDDATLLAIAERSRVHSGADLMVANTLEGADQWAYLGPLDGSYEKVARADLPVRLFAAMGHRQEQETRHG